MQSISKCGSSSIGVFTYHAWLEYYYIQFKLKNLIIVINLFINQFKSIFGPNIHQYASKYYCFKWRRHHFKVFG